MGEVIYILWLIVRWTLTLLGLGFSVWVMYRSLRRSDEPRLLVLKWLFTAGVLAMIYWVVGPMISKGDMMAAFMGVPLSAACGVALAAIWRKNIAGLIANPFASLYDGGDQELEPKPFYAIAISKRKRGKYREAVSLIRAQLERFPNDFEGQFLIAEIQAENLNDVPGAEVTIQRICNQGGHPPKTIAYALTALADWHLKFTVDRDAARQDLEKIIELFPDSEVSVIAAQ